MTWNNIPEELRSLRQWVVAGPDKIPLNPQTGYPASVADPATWGTFELAASRGMSVGFVLTESDPFTIIDLDNKPERPLTEEQWDLHRRILDAFVSYTERSTSGLGYHIIVKGKVPAGVHTKDCVEVYSSGRYMICTGAVVRSAPITEYQTYLDHLYGEMKPTPVATLDTKSEVLSDQEVVAMAERAVNSDKYIALCQGKWQLLGYPSQSEADYALLSMLAFYSPSDEQCRRLFRMSALGKRDKALRGNNYLNRCLGKIRHKQEFYDPIDIDRLKKATEEAILSKTPRQVPKTHPLLPDHKDVTFPPGLIGEIADYILATAVRPVPEVALAAAITIVSGVVGRTYNISGTGLNQYLILIAKTGSGKEGAQMGIDKLITAVRPQVPMIDQFVGPGAFASGQALIRVLDERPCFVSVLGEFGLTLQQLCDPRASSPQVMLRKVLLDLYMKSGHTSMLRSSAYADTDKNTKTIRSPSVTILGESTPQAFFDNLSNHHIAEGLIPRFTIMEYRGKRPPRNQHANVAPSSELVGRFSRLVVIALTTANNRQVCYVQKDPQAEACLDNFDRECDQLINAGNEIEAELWNRAHLKALKLAALVAVGCNFDEPKILIEHARWVVNFVKRDISNVATRFASGDVGEGDSKQIHDLKRVISEYMESPYIKLAPYLVEEKMFRDKIIPYGYLQRRTAGLSSYHTDRRGSSAALRNALGELIDSEVLVEVSPHQLFNQYGGRGRAFGLCRAV